MKMSPWGTAMLVLALPASLALWLGAAHAQAASPKIDEQLLIQDSIYHSQGRNRPPGYTIDRSLLAYMDVLHPAFASSLANLGPDDRWLDIGAGQGRAMLDYYVPERDMSQAEEREWQARRARSVAISIEDRRTYRWHQAAKSLEPGKLDYLAGKRLREYAPDELGKFQLITDVGGGFTYTSHLSQFMQKALGMLAPNGRFFAVLQNVHCEEETSKPDYTGSPFLTEIEKIDGSKMKVCAWLKSITCVKVQCQRKKEWDPPIEVYNVQKVCDDIRVPPLVAVHYLANTPPERRFQLVDSPPGAETGAAAR